MELTLKNIVLFGSVFLTALSSGLFYAWIISVIPGTKNLSDQAYVETMQSINREILNPWFFIVFFGAPLFLLLSTYFQYNLKVNSTFYILLASTLLYSIGTIGTTILGNVPLNNTLDSIDLHSLTSEGFKSARIAFEEKWNTFNLIRTFSSLTSFILILMAFANR